MKGFTRNDISNKAVIGQCTNFIAAVSAIFDEVKLCWWSRKRSTRQNHSFDRFYQFNRGRE